MSNGESDEAALKARKSRPAATVILTRIAEHSRCGLEVLLLRRSDVGAFAGMWVFPGGRVDDADEGHDDYSRAMSAAIREAHEEVSARVDRAALAPWSHWTPPLSAPARFKTWFFVAAHDDGDIAIDNHEIVDYRWMAPDRALAAALPMAPPTIVTLHELHEAGDHQTIRRGRVDPPAYVTRPGRTADGQDVMMWNGDAGYESGDADLDGPRNRLVMLNGFGGTDWIYVRA
jgi:8-oxo-dGTP pyrophosphatase MutT (NUDIX family)